MENVPQQVDQSPITNPSIKQGLGSRKENPYENVPQQVDQSPITNPSIKQEDGTQKGNS